MWVIFLLFAGSLAQQASWTPDTGWRCAWQSGCAAPNFTAEGGALPDVPSCGSLPISAGLLLTCRDPGLLQVLKGSGKISLELVFRASSDSYEAYPEGSYARIFGFSEDVLCPSSLDLSVGQRRNEVLWRLRLNDGALCNELSCPAGNISDASHSFVFVFDGYSMAIYKDGRQCAAGPSSPSRLDFSTWNTAYPTVLGNEYSMDRPWAGSVKRIRVWDSAIDVARLASMPCALGDGCTGCALSSAPLVIAVPLVADTTAPVTSAPATSPPPTTDPATTSPPGGECAFDSDCDEPPNGCFRGSCDLQTLTCIYYKPSLFCCEQPADCPVRPCQTSSCSSNDCIYATNETAVDACGVCMGDNSTCLGCDGVPNSGAKDDVCGTCGGDGGGCTMMNRELFSLFWLIFLFSLSLFLLWLVLPSLVSGPRRARTV